MDSGYSWWGIYIVITIIIFIVTLAINFYFLYNPVSEVKKIIDVNLPRILNVVDTIENTLAKIDPIINEIQTIINGVENALDALENAFCSLPGTGGIPFCQNRTTFVANGRRPGANLRF